MEDFDRIAERMRPLIWSIINGLNIYKDEEEFYQIGLIALWKALQVYDPKKGNFDTFAYSYIRGMILTELNKSRKKEDRETFFSDDYEMISIPDERGEEFEREIHFLEFVNKFPEKLSRFIIMHFVEEKTLKEIANQLGVSYSTVKLWKKESLERMQELSKDGAG